VLQLNATTGKIENIGDRLLTRAAAITRYSYGIRAEAFLLSTLGYKSYHSAFFCPLLDYFCLDPKGLDLGARLSDAGVLFELRFLNCDF
jgi:hypothetical protein